MRPLITTGIHFSTLKCYTVGTDNLCFEAFVNIIVLSGRCLRLTRGCREILYARVAFRTRRKTKIPMRMTVNIILSKHALAGVIPELSVEPEEDLIAFFAVCGFREAYDSG